MNTTTCANCGAKIEATAPLTDLADDLGWREADLAGAVWCDGDKVYVHRHSGELTCSGQTLDADAFQPVADPSR